MTPDQDLASRLREEARQSLEPRFDSLAIEFSEFQLKISQALTRATEKLKELREWDFAGLADVLSHAVEESVQHRAEDLCVLIRHAASIQRLETQEEILNSLLDGAFKDRHKVALFTVRGNRIQGWASRGYDDDAAAGIASYESSTENPVFRQALSSEARLTVDDLSEAPGLVELLLGATPGRLHFLPLRTMGRPVGILVVVPSDGPGENLEALELLISISAMRIENLALRILKEFEIAATVHRAPVPPAAEPAPPTQEPLETEAGMPSAEMPEPKEPPAGVAAGQSDESDLEVAGSMPDSVIPDQAASEPFLPTDEPAAPPLPEENEAWTKAPEITLPGLHEPPATEQRAATQPEYAPSHARLAAVEEPTRFAEEERLHSDAKRFARLLISEIKLYNEERVVEGRANRDIYVRLKRDIDRSREMYRKRVSPQVSRKVDYFHDEVVRILGENDLSTLGSDYPGALIES